MQGVLFGVYQLISVVLFLFLSVVLLYQHRLTRWLVFAFSFFTVYVLAGYLFFGRGPAYFPSDLAASARYWTEIGSILVLVFGLFAVIGYCLLKGLTSRQLMGAILVFLAAMGVLMTVIYMTLGYGSLTPGSSG